MAILLDTHILIAWINRDLAKLSKQMVDVVAEPEVPVHASVASLWEIAIKSRLGKLPLAMSVDALPEFIMSLKIGLLTIDHRHVLAQVDPEPLTRDPFDRLLLGQCAADDMKLMTTDRALAGHPLAWKGQAGV